MGKTNRNISCEENNLDDLGYVRIRRNSILTSLLLGIGIAATLSAKLSAQEVPRIRISGIITDATTGEPLESANVFLANTTLGSATDRNGFYLINNIPLGNYELVVSMMGYHLREETVYLLERTDNVFNFKLTPKVLMGREVRITAERPTEWKRDFKKFETIFLGTSENASKCEIMNAEVLNFDFDVTREIFRASADHPLQIENRALGYRIEFTLEDFVSYKDGMVNYKGIPKFDPLTPKDRKEETNWRKNRLKAYNGSLRHFLSASATNRLVKEGFLVYGAEELPTGNNKPYLYEVDTKDLISPGEFTFQKLLYFPEYLKVVYMREAIPKEYIRDTSGRTAEMRGGHLRSLEKSPTQQISWLQLNQKSVKINTLGHINDDPYALTTYGYWSWERLAEQLPLDYLP